MRKKLLIVATCIILLSIVYLLFVFDEAYAGSKEDLLASYHSVTLYAIKPITVSEVTRILEDYEMSQSNTIQSADSVSQAIPAGSSTVIAGVGNERWFYHQANQANGCQCGHHGDWSSGRDWGWNAGTRPFNSDGCAVYSLAMVFSHLNQAPITPDDVFLTLNVAYNSSDNFYNTATSSSFVSQVSIKRVDALNAMVNAYGGRYVPVNTKEEVADAIQNGAVIWCRVQNRGNTKSVWTNNGHFVGIYAVDGNSYIAYSSTDVNFMNQRQDIDDFWNVLRDKQAYAVYKN